jgi:hypothetical protein
MTRLLAAILLLACLVTPARAQPPLVWGFASANPVEPGMLFELRLIVDGASAMTLALPPELQQIEKPTIEPGAIYVPLTVREDAPAGDYTIGATVTVSGTNALAAVVVRVRAAEPQPPPIWRVMLPVVRR